MLVLVFYFSHRCETLAVNTCTLSYSAAELLDSPVIFGSTALICSGLWSRSEYYTVPVEGIWKVAACIFKRQRAKLCSDWIQKEMFLSWFGLLTIQLRQMIQ